MSANGHTPTPWMVLSSHSFSNGYNYTSIQPVTPDPETMRHLLMASGEYHVCNMMHTALHHKAELHRADASFIVRAVNSHDDLIAALKDSRAGFAQLEGFEGLRSSAKAMIEKIDAALAKAGAA